MKNNFYVNIVMVVFFLSAASVFVSSVAIYQTISIMRGESLEHTSSQSTPESLRANDSSEYLAASAGSEASPYASEEMIVPEQDPQLLVFGSIPYWDQRRAISVFKENVDVFDIISVFWYLLEEDGAISTYQYANEDGSLIDFAHEHGVKVLALIANLPEDDVWDWERVDNVIRSDERRKQHIADILALVEERGFDGVKIDYEFLRNSQTEDFTAFIEELASELHDRDKLLAVAIHAQLPGGPSRGQDIPRLQSADILSFMTYDEHWDTSEPGPPASLPWVRRVVEYAISIGVDRQKIFMGIPLYGYDWPQEGGDWGKARGIEYDEITRLANKHDVEITYHPEATSPYFSYFENGIAHEVWFENSFSFDDKLRLAKELGVGGILFWRQGREDGRVYDILLGE
ncbi:hypothetical protein C4568_00675 [Candidatus Parcubacteria bacterium]|nr:MAG: hypothetical protein C4568_00675 [Candidatus Parcubacteria bacterium]